MSHGGEAPGDRRTPRQVFSELCEGAHRGALWLERPQLGAMGEPQVELEGGIHGGRPWPGGA